MKIDLVSIHSAHNYGSVLQAYALQEKLKQYSDEVQIIDYRPNYFETQYKMFSLKVYKRYKGIFNKILHLGWRTLRWKKRYTKYKKFEDFIKENYQLTKRYTTYQQLVQDPPQADVYFTGSDQLWNTDITEGFDKTYYLEFVREDKIKASYAASLGRNKIDSKYQKQYEEAFENLDFIAVREQQAQEELQLYTNKKIWVTIDPTLLHEKQLWENLAQKSKMKIKEKYIFVYILEENEEFVKMVNEISKYLNLKVVSISKKRRFEREEIYAEAGPEDFIYFFQNAEFVITNSFHGTVFSLIFEKKNCIIPHLKTGERMCNLMKKVGLEERIITKLKELDLAKITQEIDYVTVNKQIEKERKNAEIFIETVLKNNGK